MIHAAIDTGTLFQAVWTSVVGAVGVTLAFCLLVLGAARSSELGRAGRRVAAGAYGVMAVFGLVIFFAAMVLGIVVMTTK